MNIQYEPGVTALMSASSKGHVDVVKLLLQKGADTNVRTKGGSTALSALFKKGHVEVVKLLRAHGAKE